jgi:RimJ/RimL family protein N-acetyltransferase
MTHLETERLRLLPLAQADSENMSRLLLGDSAAIRMTEAMPDPCTGIRARAWIARRRRPCEKIFAIEIQGDGSFIGCIGLVEAGDGGALGYWLGRPYWGRGYATEAGGALVGLARAQGLARLEAETFVGNTASAGGLKKHGFEPGRVVRRLIEARGEMRRMQEFVLQMA